MPLRLAIAGAGGRMGRMLLAAAEADPAVQVAAAIDHASSPSVGQSICGAVVTDDVGALADSDVLIDFTRPEGTLLHLAACAERRVNAVIGTTGFGQAQLATVRGYSAKIAIVLAPNMSLGVNVTAKLVAMAAGALGMDADIEVFEAHHKLKVDAPSGTALMLGEVAALARSQNIADVAVFDRRGVGGERQPGSIGFSSMRAGDIIGDHSVFFVLNGERIEITHRSSSRETYAHGAIRAAKFLADKRIGLFGMSDVLGLDAKR
ncbi:MAG: 4-hydroxy-tetrahydrodipicolinate reductase [Burkholderiales bacterium]